MKTIATEKEAPTAAGRGKVPRIGEILLARRFITERQMERALEYQREVRPNKLLGQVLLELELITPEDLLSTLAEASRVEFVTPTAQQVDPEVLKMFPREFLEENLVLPLRSSGADLIVAVEDFTNVFLIEDIERLAGCNVRIVAATGASIREILQTLRETVEEFRFDAIMEEMSDEELTVVEQHDEQVDDLESAASDSPVIRLVNHIVHGAIHEKASDIHIEPDHDLFRVRYRIDGELYEKIRPPYTMLPAVVSRIKIMAGMDIAERRLPQDGGITVMVDRRPVDLRISTMPTKFGEKVVVRVIDNKAGILDLASLGFSSRMLDNLRQVISEPNGVILVTGPTGSGKTTTLYGCLSEILTGKLNVCTIEDPIEFNLNGINQFQMNEKVGFTFARALRSLLRQDPDVIMVGEIRDTETAQIAVQAALTGHLVLSTLHTNDAPSAVTRLINMHVEAYLVAASLRGVLAQRLVRRICANCRELAEPSPRSQRLMSDMFGDGSPEAELYTGTGCARCRNTGYAGRIGIYELFVPETDVLDAIARGASLQEVRRMSKYTTLRHDGIEKVAAGITSIDALAEILTRRNESDVKPIPERQEEVWYQRTRSDD